VGNRRVCAASESFGVPRRTRPGLALAADKPYSGAMLHAHLPERLVGDPHFRWRGGEVSRFESLSDMVFAFALTLIVVSMEVPRTFGQLTAVLAQLPAFAFSFAMLVMCWWFHYLYHRRFGFEDFPSFLLNALLLFVILFYVYPLKFLSTMLQAVFTGNGVSGTLPDGTPVQMFETELELGHLMILYSAGVAIVFGLFAAMYVLAWRRRELLELNPRERLLTRAGLWSHVGSAAIALLSISLALLWREPAGYAAAGWVYFLMWPLHMTLGIVVGRRVERLAQAA